MIVSFIPIGLYYISYINICICNISRTNIETAKRPRTKHNNKNKVQNKPKSRKRGNKNWNVHKCSQEETNTALRKNDIIILTTISMPHMFWDVLDQIKWKWFRCGVYSKAFRLVTWNFMVSDGESPRCPPRWSQRNAVNGCQRFISSGWWFFATPLKNMNVNWDDDISNINGKMPNSWQPNHQPGIQLQLTHTNCFSPLHRGTQKYTVSISPWVGLEWGISLVLIHYSW